jgi:Co/Zn/Cd efflux system component
MLRGGVRVSRLLSKQTCWCVPKRCSFHHTPPRYHKGHSHGPSASDSLLALNATARKDCDRVTKIGMAANFGLVIAKTAAGVLGNSTALIADAVHSMSDLASDVITLVTVQQVRKPHSDNHPFG